MRRRTFMGLAVLLLATAGAAVGVVVASGNKTTNARVPTSIRPNSSISSSTIHTRATTPTVTSLPTSSTSSITTSIVPLPGSLSGIDFAVGNYYVQSGLVAGPIQVECKRYGTTAAIGQLFSANSSQYFATGTTIYDCAPVDNGSIAGCFAVSNGAAFNESSGGPLTCSGQPLTPSVTGQYLPPTDAHIIQLVENDWNSTQAANDEPSADFSGVQFTITPLTDASTLAAGEVDTYLSHWFLVEFNFGGSTYSEDANPWTQEVTQNSISTQVG